MHFIHQLDSILPHAKPSMMHLELMWNGCDVIITPIPSYAVNPNSLQTGRKFNYQYDYTQTDDELAQATISASEA